MLKKMTTCSMADKGLPGSSECFSSEILKGILSRSEDFLSSKPNTGPIIFAGRLES
jgi:hypothetical protein